ncbi:agamous-like MADS-box protein AGL80 [Quillaja saponaria]|uniref:Agamous-like MADS-box protein AGL80 n=1 Tax=Quillaja saponaria TaxID=32244 RepID=A0AAD7PN99_QUISA|nr:agamous-like MADS-box protein AGL80 [Quillaja saponaria]
MVNQDSFLRQRITKVEEQVKKQRRENREKEMEQVMYQSLVGDQGLQKLNLVDLNELGWMVDRNIKETVEKMKQLGAFGPKSAMTTVSNVYQEAVHHMTSNNRDQTQDDHEATKNMEMQNQQWIMDMLRSNDHNIMGFGRNVDQEVTHPPTTAFNINGNMWCNFPFP